MTFPSLKTGSWCKSCLLYTSSSQQTQPLCRMVMIIWKGLRWKRSWQPFYSVWSAVSYTHLDVYKRQVRIPEHISKPLFPGSFISRITRCGAASFNCSIVLEKSVTAKDVYKRQHLLIYWTKQYCICKSILWDFRFFLCITFYLPCLHQSANQKFR